MKTIIYGICKNEIKHVERFMSFTKEADAVYIADTGSTDGTGEKLKELGAKVFDIRIKPWRFDYARNAILQLLPEDTDWCFSLDLDECVRNGWRKELENISTNKPNVKRVSFYFNWKMPSGITPASSFYSTKIHNRFDYIWKYPCHEATVYNGEFGNESTLTSDKIIVDHLPDNSKSRASYLGLLELAYNENSNDPRNVYYLGREYYYTKQYEKAIPLLKKHVQGMSNSIWEVERASAMRHLAYCYGGLNKTGEKVQWLLKAAGEFPYVREAWYDLAETFFNLQRYDGLYYASQMCLNVKDRYLDYISRGDCWDERIYGYASLGCWGIGLREQGFELGKKAHEMNPNNQVVKSNLKNMAEQLNISYDFK